MELLLTLTFVIAASLCWGSFLNVVAYRLAAEKDFFTARSYCPECNTMIAWYDNIPVISWVMLGGTCRTCKAPISLLYPFVEILTAFIFTTYIYLSSYTYFFTPHFNIGSYLLGIGLTPTQDFGATVAYLLFFSALIVATRTDLQALVIPQLVTVWMIPLGVLFSFLGFTAISVQQSMIGSMLGYGALWLIAFIFKRITKKDGLGVGDMELLSMIGSFLGPFGVWFSVMIGSVSGLLFGGLYLVFAGKDRSTRIPFGPFLSLGAVLYFFLHDTLMRIFMI